MKTTSQMITLTGLCVLLAGTTTAAFAQDNGAYGNHHGGQGGYSQRHYGQGGQYGQHQDSDYRRSDQYRHAGQNERRRLDRLHSAYGRAATHGSQYHGDPHHGNPGQYQGDPGQYQGGGQHQGDSHQGSDHQGGDHQGDQHQHDNNH